MDCPILLRKPILLTPLLISKSVGKRGFFAVCTGCHAFGHHLIGPTIEEIQMIYEDNPEAMADYIAEPIKVREDYSEMPPQNYLSAETRLAIAKYMLKAKNKKSSDQKFMEGVEQRKKELESTN